jgi:hypothetical protein
VHSSVVVPPPPPPHTPAIAEGSGVGDSGAALAGATGNNWATTPAPGALAGIYTPPPASAHMSMDQLSSLVVTYTGKKKIKPGVGASARVARAKAMQSNLK